MCHIVREVCLHLIERTLAQNGTHKIVEREAENKHNEERSGKNTRHLPEHYPLYWGQLQQICAMTVQVGCIAIGRHLTFNTRSDDRYSVGISIRRVGRTAAFEIQQPVGSGYTQIIQVLCKQTVEVLCIGIAHHIQARMQPPL